MTETANKYKITKYSCFFSYLANGPVFALPPILLMTFHNMYGISYTLLGTLVLINFCTQLSIDLIFSFFTKYFNIKKTIRTMPLITFIGILIYALSPILFPNHVFWGLAIGTVIFSVSAGLGEVLLSPTVAAIPSDNSERDMSLLHAAYAGGVITVVALATIFLKIFGAHNWMYIMIGLSAFSLISFVLFSVSPIPPMNISYSKGEKSSRRGRFGILLCVFCIFLGAAAECGMTNWISTYLESVLGLPKTVGDLAGLAAFAILLGMGRILYAKFGKNIYKVLVWGMIGSVICYLVAGLVSNLIISMLACMLTGLCTSMLWPGNLIYMEEKFNGPGVAVYALMASGGDLGASVAPQLMGIIVDKVAVSDWASNLAITTAMTTEQIGMKVSMLVTAIFPIVGVFVLLYMKKFFSKSV